MPRKTVDNLNGLDSRDAVWSAIRKLRIFTVRDLTMETTLQEDTVRSYVTGLRNAGFLAEAGEKKSGVRGIAGKAKLWKLVKDAGIDTPRVRKDGTLVVQGIGRMQMWRTMRIIGTFSALSLAVNASTEDCQVAEETAKEYIIFLHRAGYLGRIYKGRYRLLPSRYTGPKPPMIQRVKQVWDANLKKVMWSNNGGCHDPKRQS